MDRSEARNRLRWLKAAAVTTMDREALDLAIEVLQGAEDMGEVSDGYHTFNQLYHQRAVLFATIVNQNKDKAWKSWKHEDGKFCFDKEGEWFIVGVDTPEGSYTYHYEKKHWDMFDCEELDKGKHWDGHTEDDVTRLLSLQPTEQVTGKLKKPCDSLLTSDLQGCKEQKSKLESDTISRQAAINAIENTDVEITAEEWDELTNAIGSLPSAEPMPVGDAISKHDLWRIIEDNAYWITYNETSKEKGMTLTGINQALNECLPVEAVAKTATSTEDCISRQAAIEAIEKAYCIPCKERGDDYNEVRCRACNFDDAISQIDAVPPVEPKRPKGEWIEYIDDRNGRRYDECPSCHKIILNAVDYDVLDGERYSMDYCPNCGCDCRGDKE